MSRARSCRVGPSLQRLATVEFPGRLSGACSGFALDPCDGRWRRAWSEKLPANARDNPAIASAWARGQIRQVEDRYAAGDGDRACAERTIVALSIKFQVLSRFTAYVAVDRSQTVNLVAALHQIVQPVDTPSGWRDSAVMSLGRTAKRAMARPTDRCLRLMPDARSDLHLPVASSAIEDSRVSQSERKRTIPAHGRETFERGTLDGLATTRRRQDRFRIGSKSGRYMLMAVWEN